MSSDGLQWLERPGELRRPILVAAFEGWNDAGDAASFATAWLVKHGDASTIATIDPEEHFDFQSRRPQVELVDGVTRRILWPETTFSVARYPERDLVVLRGIEPSYRWRSFCDAVLTVASDTGCAMVVTFGALLADVPHTRDVRVTGTATDDDLAKRLELQRSRYEGPTGIVGVLHDACTRRDVDSASLWAPVPHYIAAPPNPPASLALLDRFGSLTGITFDLSRVRRTAATWRDKVNEVADADNEIESYVRRLEERYDAEEPTPWGQNLPTGDDLASELERYLRELPGDT